jgi:hypothetical protein
MKTEQQTTLVNSPIDLDINVDPKPFCGTHIFYEGK